MAQSYPEICEVGERGKWFEFAEKLQRHQNHDSMLGTVVKSLGYTAKAYEPALPYPICSQKVGDKQAFTIYV